jgi:hypothetical protein
MIDIFASDAQRPVCGACNKAHCYAYNRSKDKKSCPPLCDCVYDKNTFPPPPLPPVPASADDELIQKIGACLKFIWRILFSHVDFNCIECLEARLETQESRIQEILQTAFRSPSPEAQECGEEPRVLNAECPSRQPRPKLAARTSSSDSLANHSLTTSISSLSPEDDPVDALEWPDGDQYSFHWPGQLPKPELLHNLYVHHDRIIQPHIQGMFSAWTCSSPASPFPHTCLTGHTSKSC